MDNGRCRMHGGKNSGPPAANQNARKHGAYSALMDVLSDEERAIWGDVETEPGPALDNEIRFAEIRQRRMLAFIRDRMGGAVAPAYEAALSRITGDKLRALEAKHRAATGGDSRDGLAKFLAAIDGLAEDVDTP